MTDSTKTAVSAGELRQFGFIFATLVIALFALLIPWLTDSLWQRMWPWYLSGAVVLPALLWPPGLTPLYRAWMKFGDIAGWINTRIILLLLFYLIVFPVGLIMKLFKLDPMRRRLEPSATSYRVTPTHPATNNHLERPY